MIQIKDRQGAICSVLSMISSVCWRQFLGTRDDKQESITAIALLRQSKSEGDVTRHAPSPELSRQKLLGFLQGRQLAVLATASLDGTPEAALINIAVTPELEVIFETTTATQKFRNLEHNPRVSLVIGWESDATLQMNGLVDAPMGGELERLKGFFLESFPDKFSHQYWPGNDYFRVRPYWARLSNYGSGRGVEEFRLAIDESLYPTLQKGWVQRLLDLIAPE